MTPPSARTWFGLRFARPLAVGIALASLVGARPQCERQSPGTPCEGGDVVVLPGGCAEIDDPCGSGWSNLFNLSMVDGIAGVYFEVDRRPTGNSVRLCAADTVALTLGRQVSYRVIDDSGAAHLVSRTVATIAPIEITVTSDADTVVAGDTLQVTAHVTGGVPPYRYHWVVTCSEMGGVIGSDVGPTASLVAPCGYCYVIVKDALNTPASSQARFPTYPRVSVTALPKVIGPGETSSLTPTVIGRELIQSHWWTPTTGLAFPGSWDNLASPVATTTYTFHVKTYDGLQSQGSATVTVQ